MLHSSAREPVKADPGCAGYDIFSISDYTINPGTRKLISTGISTEIPNNYYLRVAPRSGMSVRGIDVGAGVVDSSYRGELKVLLINNTSDNYEVKKHDRIAQLIMERCSNTNVILVNDDLSETERNTSGFGSTGK